MTRTLRPPLVSYFAMNISFHCSPPLFIAKALPVPQHGSSGLWLHSQCKKNFLSYSSTLRKINRIRYWPKKSKKKSEHEGTLKKKEVATLEVKQEKDSEHEGTFKNKEDEMAGSTARNARTKLTPR